MILDSFKTYSFDAVLFSFSVTYVPLFTLIEFIAYLGWIKVAETLLYPWGDDDEDFQVNYVIDRNFQVKYLSSLKNKELSSSYQILHYTLLVAANGPKDK